MEKNKSILNKIREWIEENFFGLIIFLVVTLIIILIASLFIPINVSHFPNETLELNKYSAGVDQRTIIIRSISYIISGVSVVIAFVSLLQSKKSELKRERLQVMPFPAYAVPLGDLDYSNTASSKVVIKRNNTYPDSVVQSTFDILIKNIGLGSLVDYVIQEAYYEDTKGESYDLSVDFQTNFILGKQETTRMTIDLMADFNSENIAGQANLRKMTLIASFTDLLGHHYTQEFTIHSEVQSVGNKKMTNVDGKNKTAFIYALTPQKVTHAHPIEQ